MERFTKKTLNSLISDCIDYNKERPTFKKLTSYINNSLLYLSFDTFNTLKVSEDEIKECVNKHNDIKLYIKDEYVHSNDHVLDFLDSLKNKDLERVLDDIDKTPIPFLDEDNEIKYIPTDCMSVEDIFTLRGIIRRQNTRRLMKRYQNIRRIYYERKSCLIMKDYILSAIESLGDKDLYQRTVDEYEKLGHTTEELSEAIRINEEALKEIKEYGLNENILKVIKDDDEIYCCL